MSAACSYRNWVVPSFVLLTLMAVILLASFPFLEPGTTSYTLALLDVIVLVVAFGLVGGGNWYCTKWASNRKVQNRR